MPQSLGPIGFDSLRIGALTPAPPVTPRRAFDPQPLSPSLRDYEPTLTGQLT